jgi:hypothetical protein
LKQAGDNRGELEKVLKHYSRNPADSLKLRAAEFLIVNMPGKYSAYYDAPWNDVATVYLRWSSSPDIGKVLDVYGIGEPVKREDVKYITAEYLISNIELSFREWQERPWGKHIPFDAFCEEILPYRIDCEPLENWRAKALASFADLDTVLKRPGMTSVEACRTVNDKLPRFRVDKDFSQMNFSQLMSASRGTCDNMAALAAFTMRALGIPVTVDFTPHWAKSKTGHSWNTVRDSAGNHVSFMGAETNPYRPHQGNTLLKAKAYRKMFALQQNILAEERHIPDLLGNHRNMKDITSEHAGIADTVTVPLTGTSPLPNGYVYLALLYGNEWYPVAWSACGGESALFTSVGKDIVYLPVSFSDGRQIPAGDPFLLDSGGDVNVFSRNPDTLLTFDSIIAPAALSYPPRMLNGVFECACRPDFSDARVLHAVDRIPEYPYREAVLKTPAKCRYVRYRSPPGGWCNVAEIIFYGRDGKPVPGTNTGSPGAWNGTEMTCDKAFDGDTVTFYDAATANDAWTGLDFGESKTVCRIRYYPRMNENRISGGIEYELFFMTGDGWTSLGKPAVSNGSSIQFRAPAQGLFYVKNSTLKWNGAAILSVKGRKQYWK